MNMCVVTGGTNTDLAAEVSHTEGYMQRSGMASLQ